MAKILVIDDETAFRDGFLETLTDLGHTAIGAGSEKIALQLLQQDIFNLVFVDFRMPGTTGVETMKLIRQKKGDSTPPMVMVTAFSDSQNTIEAMRIGAYDHLTKPVSKSEIKRVVDSVMDAFPSPELSACRELQSAQRPIIVGHHESVREVLKMIGRLAATETTVLISGETGTGKEVVAHAIHDNSGRAGGAFIAVNCAAIPENLLESELFGHVRGSFTGATNERKGSFQLAEGGTLFLDEIGDMDLALQAKILRAVQEREVVAVGGSKPIRVNCRIIAATHQNLREMVDRGEFRQDLFYRLNVVQLPLPALRDRSSDIEELSRHFLIELGASAMFLSEKALIKLKGYNWPGNIRELKNVIDRAVVVARGRTITDDDILLSNSPDRTDGFEVDEEGDLDWHQSMARLERKLLVQALREANGNRSEAARKLGIQRQLLYSKLKEHKLIEP